MLKLKKVSYVELEKRFSEIESWNKLSKNENAYNTKQFSKNVDSDFDWWLAFDGNEFVGAVSVNVNGKDVYINEGMAKPGSGYGEKMLREIFKHYENSINGIKSISFDAWSKSNQSKLEGYYNRVFSDFKRTKNSWGGSRYTKTFESRKSIYDEINEEFSKMIEEEALLMGDVSNESSEVMPPSSASTVDNSIMKDNGKINDHSIMFSDTLGDYTPGDGVMSAKNNYTGTGLSAMNIQKRIPESEERIDKNFKQHFLESDIQGLEHYSENDLKKAIIDQILERLDASNVTDDEVSIKAIAICGSRNRGTAKEDSDLDVVMEYSGSMREDDAFNILHDEEYPDGTMMIDDVEVDVNPIRRQESGNIENFLKKSKEYDDYILSNQPLVEKKKKRKKRQHFRRFYGYYPFWRIVPVRPLPPTPPPGLPPGPPPAPPSPDVPSGGDSGGDVGGSIGGDAGGGAAAGPVGEAGPRYDGVIPPRNVLIALHKVPERKILDSAFQAYDLDGEAEEYAVDSIAYSPDKEVYVLKIERMNNDGKTIRRLWLPMDFNYKTRKFEKVKDSDKSRILSKDDVKAYFGAERPRDVNMWVVWGNEKLMEDNENDELPKIGDRIKIKDHIRCIQTGQWGEIIPTPDKAMDSYNGDKLWYVKFDNPKYGIQGFGISFSDLDSIHREK